MDPTVAACVSQSAIDRCHNSYLNSHAMCLKLTDGPDRLVRVRDSQLPISDDADSCQIDDLEPRQKNGRIGPSKTTAVPGTRYRILDVRERHHPQIMLYQAPKKLRVTIPSSVGVHGLEI